MLVSQRFSLFRQAFFVYNSKQFVQKTSEGNAVKQTPKYLALLVAAVFALNGCKDGGQNDNKKPTEETQKVQSKDEMNMLVRLRQAGGAGRRHGGQYSGL